METAFRSGRILNVRMNPAGSLIALHVREDEEEWTVELVDLEAGTLTVMATSASPFVRMEWSGDQTLVVTARPSRRTSLVSVIRIEEAADGGRGFSHTRLPEGVVVSVLPGEPDHILYATRVRHNSTGTGGQMMVHRMDISSAASIEAFQPTLGTRLNRGLQDDSHWLVDAGGGCVRRSSSAARAMSWCMARPRTSRTCSTSRRTASSIRWPCRPTPV